MSAAFDDKSIILSLTNGPLSFILKTNDLLFFKFVTFTALGSGKVLWAAVSAYWLYISPFAVNLPWNFGPYHDAIPVLL